MIHINVADIINQKNRVITEALLISKNIFHNAKTFRLVKKFSWILANKSLIWFLGEKSQNIRH